MLVYVDVQRVVHEHDPFFELGFQPLTGGYCHLPQAPSLRCVLAAPLVSGWSRVAARGMDYDLGRFRFFVERPEEGDPIVLLWDGQSRWLADGRHRLGAAWLTGRPSIRALLAPCPLGAPWSA